VDDREVLIGRTRGDPPYYMIVGLYADSREAIEAILATPEGQETVKEVAKFATGGAAFFYDEEEVLIPCRLGF
jgi:uncharacterized protein (TIGR02118 family)